MDQAYQINQIRIGQPNPTKRLESGPIFDRFVGFGAVHSPQNFLDSSHNLAEAG
jgi:hypothetical protein